MNQYILAICIPTYNRGALFVKDVIGILTNPDKRFCLIIQDNKSTDGTYEELSKIQDDRLYLQQNIENIGGISNTKQVCMNSEKSKFMLFCLDKDRIIPSRISSFIDFLISHNPHSGYIDLYCKLQNSSIEHVSKGYNAICKTAYLSKHPSGFFWNSYEFRQHLQSIPSVLIDEFPFWMDIVQSHFAMLNDVYILHVGLIEHAPFREDYMAKRPKTLTYDEDNIYFSYKKRVEAFEKYVCDLQNLNIKGCERNKIVYCLYVVLLTHLTIGFKKAYEDEGNCWHYNVQKRKVGVKDYYRNVKMVYTELINNKTIKLSKIILQFLYFFATIRILPTAIKSLIK